MIRHMLLFSFRPDVSETDRNQLLDGLRSFPSWFPDMRGFELGRNESRRDSSYEYGMTLTFESFGKLQEYLDSKQHERFTADRFSPLVSGRAIVSFEL